MNSFFYNHSIKISHIWNTKTQIKYIKEAIRMATQIAATPIIKGLEAEKIFQEVHRKPSEKTEKGAKKLADIFDKMMK